MALQKFSYPETEEKALTVNHQNEAYLFIDSADKNLLVNGNYASSASSGSSSTSFIINRQKINGFGELSRVAITEYQFPWVTPNVNVRNRIFAFIGNVSGTLTQYYVILPEDFYLPSELATALQTALNTVQYTNYPANTSASYGGTTWVVSVNAKTNAFTVSNSNTSVIWAPSSINNAPDIFGLMSFPNRNVTSVADLQNSWIGSPPSMAYTSYIDVCSSALTRFQQTKDTLTQFNHTNIICRIYLNDGLNQPNTYFGSRPATIYRQIQDPKWMRWNKDQMISQIDIQYYDDEGNLLYIPSTVNSTYQIFTMKMSES